MCDENNMNIQAPEITEFEQIFWSNICIIIIIIIIAVICIIVNYIIIVARCFTNNFVDIKCTIGQYRLDLY